MPKQHIHNKSQLKTKRQELRKKLTPAEAFLWTHIKSRQLKGKRFTKQHSIGNYIVDFYCASEKLIIELDGEVHNNPVTQEYDNIRSSYLENLGYTVIRFENKLVFENLPSVLKAIALNFKN
ncbi:endonuclease domain-containing protein [Hanstruepera marina]|uniref:endonuclease domain-containing protein n=1 Tax=Hanstruepera marina TaxID=2873265 RepID=UPI001CA61591|nr:endonuclease domain-containing protein [Hanstruepera marina]